MVGFARTNAEPTLQVKMVSAGLAGCIGDVITFPLDVAKVRLQVRTERCQDVNLGLTRKGSIIRLCYDHISWNFTGTYHHTHYSNVIMSAMASQITGVSIVCSSFYSGADQRKHQSAALLAFVRGIHRSPVDSPRKGPVTRKMFPFDYAIML